jgi:hypothetical protein
MYSCRGTKFSRWHFLHFQFLKTGRSSDSQNRAVKELIAIGFRVQVLDGFLNSVLAFARTRHGSWASYSEY